MQPHSLTLNYTLLITDLLPICAPVQFLETEPTVVFLLYLTYGIP